MINIIEKNQKNQYAFKSYAGLDWSINIDDNNKAITLSKDPAGTHKDSKWRTFASDDMLELIQFCMSSGYYVKADIIEQVIDSTIESNQPVSDGVIRGFADYIGALSIVIGTEKLAELEAYCLANGYQFDERLKGA
tara:strand:- start:1320 stop:1727 length:408 start_codon:yes stop_codon:yes gene_type:complete